jgi:3-oxoacyl-[acyl-carrier protein] reductase
MDDVANAAEYLASDLAGFISGHHLLVSGGAPA